MEVGLPWTWQGSEPEYKWRPTYHISKYLKVINQAKELLGVCFMLWILINIPSYLLERAYFNLEFSKPQNS